MDAREMGRLGGKARAERLSAEERRSIAVKAGKASQVARRKRAREAKKLNPPTNGRKAAPNYRSDNE